MKPNALFPFAQGFTLIETVAALLLLSIIATGLVTTNAQLFRGQVGIRPLQISSPWLQACAERVLAMRRELGFQVNPAYDAACDSLTGSDSFNVVVTDNSGTLSCPTSAQCQMVRIHFKSGADVLGPVVLQLMNY